MSVTVDANVLVYASNRDAPVHDQARELIESLAAGPTITYLFWPTVMGYLRIVTHPAILPSPLSPAVAIANIEALSRLAQVRMPGEADGFWQIYLRTRGRADRGNAIPDGHLAALMIQQGVSTIYTRDRDFRTFDGIKAVDPFA